ncbi:MAG TPA: hypothetical protein VHO90_17755 [Bacteroidales bacterium]|nr:hypothetical protein [Bacteroidales bacterium]
MGTVIRDDLNSYKEIEIFGSPLLIVTGKSTYLLKDAAVGELGATTRSKEGACPCSVRMHEINGQKRKRRFI